MKKIIYSTILIALCAVIYYSCNNREDKRIMRVVDCGIRHKVPQNPLDGDSGDKVKTIEFCGVTLGLNVEWIGSDDTKVPKHIALLTSRQDKETFEALKDGLIKFLGNPNNEEYEVGDDNLVYGRVEWNKGFSVTLRNIHSDEGGLIIFIM